MQVTYLILVHDRPSQLAALLDLLLVLRDRAVVHVDAKADELEFRRATRHHGDRVCFTERRHAVNWGGFGVVAATVTALELAADRMPGDYYVLLSGADLPIKPAVRLHEELASGAVYMTRWRMPADHLGKPMSRLDRFHLTPRSRGSHLTDRLDRHLLARLPKRDVHRGLAGLVPYAGSQWWAVPHGCAIEVLKFIHRSPRFVRFFRFVQVPDEIFFQTIVLGLPTAWDVRGNLTYADWSRPVGDGASPAVLGTGDLPALARTDKFFARKFDVEGDPAVYARIRSELLGGTT